MARILKIGGLAWLYSSSSFATSTQKSYTDVSYRAVAKWGWIRGGSDRQGDGTGSTRDSQSDDLEPLSSLLGEESNTPRDFSPPEDFYNELEQASRDFTTTSGSDALGDEADDYDLYETEASAPILERNGPRHVEDYDLYETEASAPIMKKKISPKDLLEIQEASGPTKRKNLGPNKHNYAKKQTSPISSTSSENSSNDTSSKGKKMEEEEEEESMIKKHRDGKGVANKARAAARRAGRVGAAAALLAAGYFLVALLRVLLAPLARGLWAGAEAITSSATFAGISPFLLYFVQFAFNKKEHNKMKEKADLWEPKQNFIFEVIHERHRVDRRALETAEAAAALDRARDLPARAAAAVAAARTGRAAAAAPPAAAAAKTGNLLAKWKAFKGATAADNNLAKVTCPRHHPLKPFGPKPPAPAAAAAGRAEEAKEKGASAAGAAAAADCPGAHGLAAFAAPSAGWHCSRCAEGGGGGAPAAAAAAPRLLPDGAVLHGCRGCDFDLCEWCFRAAAAEGGAAAAAAATAAVVQCAQCKTKEGQAAASAEDDGSRKKKKKAKSAKKDKQEEEEGWWGCVAPGCQTFALCPACHRGRLEEAVKKEEAQRLTQAYLDVAFAKVDRRQFDEAERAEKAAAARREEARARRALGRALRVSAAALPPPSSAGAAAAAAAGGGGRVLALRWPDREVERKMALDNKSGRPVIGNPQLDYLCRAVDFLLQVGEAGGGLGGGGGGGDEVVLVLESPGGRVDEYGLAAAQLKRLRDAGLSLTVCVDQIAASGGYMMACIGSKIIAAPFAYIGSVGVMMPALLNFQKALQSREVDSYEFSAGKSKIGVTQLGKVTEEKLKTTQDSLEKIHRSFKDLIKQARPGVDVEAVGTGEVWLAGEALGLGLVDALETSDAYLARRAEESHVYMMRRRNKKAGYGLLGALGGGGGGLIQSFEHALLSQFSKSKVFAKLLEQICKDIVKELSKTIINEHKLF